ncbi:putative metabotropic glutamate receptor mgl-1 [Taenia solium]|eukprot:TsM_000163400 transcript=TsM_000163400 gene=TsM_000163400
MIRLSLCRFGSVRKYSKKQQCCWTCEECQSNQIIVNLTHCQTCEDQYWPTLDRRKCELLEAPFNGIESFRPEIKSRQEGEDGRSVTIFPHSVILLFQNYFMQRIKRKRV